MPSPLPAPRNASPATGIHHPPRKQTVFRLALVFAISAFGLRAAEPPAEAPDALTAYVNRAQADAAWELQSKSTLQGCEHWVIKLKSQVWQGIPWEHDLAVFLPENVAPGRKMLLINNGGKINPTRIQAGILIALQARAPVAVLLGVPRQPLFEGLTEDRLIAETFIQYQKTNDASWPLLFPMVKSVTAAMDALQDFSQREWGVKTDEFIVNGASKRGWTSWLAAAADPRVVAIAPMVIDMLNIPGQIAAQQENFGGFSEQLHPYVERGLLPLGRTPETARLWTMVDPWTYRARYTLPKLILLGNNDPYWNTDALNLYWDGLPGEKHISYTPNAGHDLRETGPAGGKELLPLRALTTLAAFVRSQIGGHPLPALEWRHQDAGNDRLRLTVTSATPPRDLHLWTATSSTRDFRKARWESRPVECVPGHPAVAEIARPADGCVAFYIAAGYDFEGLALRLCTQLRIAGPALAAAASGAPPPLSP